MKPKPSVRIGAELNTRILLRVPASLKQQIEARAQKESRSLSQMVRLLIERGFKK